MGMTTATAEQAREFLRIMTGPDQPERTHEERMLERRLVMCAASIVLKHDKNAAREAYEIANRKAHDAFIAAYNAIDSWN